MRLSAICAHVRSSRSVPPGGEAGVVITYLGEASVQVHNPALRFDQLVGVALWRTRLMTS